VDSRLVTAIEVVVGVPAVLVLYIWGTERLVTLAPLRWQPRMRPWLWLAPAFAFLGFFLLYPAVRTIIRSLQSKSELKPKFVGLANYKWFFTNSDALGALINNILWLLMPDPVHRSASGCWWRCWSTGSTTSRSRRASSSCRWRSAWSRPASSGSSCTTTSAR
jgi:hypothetical protein